MKWMLQFYQGYILCPHPLTFSLSPPPSWLEYPLKHSAVIYGFSNLRYQNWILATFGPPMIFSWPMGPARYLWAAEGHQNISLGQPDGYFWPKGPAKDCRTHDSAAADRIMICTPELYWNHYFYLQLGPI